MAKILKFANFCARLTPLMMPRRMLYTITNRASSIHTHTLISARKILSKCALGKIFSYSDPLGCATKYSVKKNTKIVFTVRDKLKKQLIPSCPVPSCPVPSCPICFHPVPCPSLVGQSGKLLQLRLACLSPVGALFYRFK